MSLFGDGKREALLALLLLSLLAAVQHAPGLLFHAPRHVDASLQISEGAQNQEVLQPAMAQAVATLAEGSLPTWNPNCRFGEPFSVTGAPVLYPPFWLLGLPGGRALVDIVVFLHALLACTTMFRFLRSLSISRYVAFLGGGCFGLGWFFLASAGRLHEAAAAAWLPLALELTWRTLRSRTDRKRTGPLLGLVIAVLFATGGTSTATIGVGLAIAFVLSGLGLVDRESRREGGRQLALAAGLALLCSAPLWLDAAQLSGELRAHDVAPDARRLQLEGLASVLAPGLFQDLDSSGPLQLLMINPGADAIELALYPGAIMLFAMLLGLFRPKRTLRGLFWAFTGAFGVVLTLDGPIGQMLFDPLPWQVDSPGAGLLLLHMSVIVLGCTALDNFFDAPIARRFSVPLTSALVGAAACAVLVAAWVLPREWALAPLLAGLERHPWDGATSEALDHVALHLLPFGITAALIAAVFPFWHRIGILRFKWVIGTIAIGELLALGLLMVPRAPDAEGLLDEPRDLASRLPATRGRAVGSGDRSLPPGTQVAAYGVSVVNTNGRALLDRTARLLEAIDPGIVRSGRRTTLSGLSVSAQFDDPLLAIGAVDIAFARNPIVAEDFVPLTPTPGMAGSPATSTSGIGHAVHVAHRRTLPAADRARIHYTAIPAASREEAAQRLHELSRQTAGALASDRPDANMPLVVEHAPADFEPREGVDPATIHIVRDDPDCIEIDVDLGAARGYLSLADAWAPGWSVTVDGEPAAILPAQLAFRAVALDEGRHTVIMRHDPWSERFGIPLAACGLTLVLLLQVLARFTGARR